MRDLLKIQFYPGPLVYFPEEGCGVIYKLLQDLCAELCLSTTFAIVGSSSRHEIWVSCDWGDYGWHFIGDRPDVFPLFREMMA